MNACNGLQAVQDTEWLSCCMTALLLVSFDHLIIVLGSSFPGFEKAMQSCMTSSAALALMLPCAQWHNSCTNLDIFAVWVAEYTWNAATLGSLLPMTFPQVFDVELVSHVLCFRLHPMNCFTHDALSHGLQGRIAFCWQLMWVAKGALQTSSPAAS